MNPLPLTDPTGRVLAYACGRCLHVGTSGVRMVVRPADLDEITADHLEAIHLRAEKCCLCDNCGVPLLYDGDGYLRFGRCPPCGKAERHASRLRLIRDLTRPRLRRALAAIARLRKAPLHVVGGVVQPPGAPVSGGSLYIDAAGRVTAAATGGRGKP